jgi:hypothetical protein
VPAACRRTPNSGLPQSEEEPQFMYFDSGLGVAR